MRMAIMDMKLKCTKCGYGIPLTSEEHRKVSEVKCPKCANICSILRDDEETLIEE